MKLEVQFSEVHQFISSQYEIDIDLKNIEKNKVEATYIDSVILNIKEVKDRKILIRYEVDGLAHVVSKIAHFFLEKKLDQLPVEWDSKTEEIRIDLNKIPQLKDFFKYMSISEILFVNDTIVIETLINWQNLKPE